MRTDSYQTDSDADAVEGALDEFFTALGDRQDLDLLESGETSDERSREYSFQAGSSSVGVVYRVDDSVNIEFYGAGPAVDRIYSTFSREMSHKI